MQQLEIEPYQIALFGKRGFSKELRSLAGKKLALYSAEDFDALLKSSSKRETSSSSNTISLKNLFV